MSAISKKRKKTGVEQSVKDPTERLKSLWEIFKMQDDFELSTCGREPVMSIDGGNGQFSLPYQAIIQLERCLYEASHVISLEEVARIQRLVEPGLEAAKTALFSASILLITMLRQLQERQSHQEELLAKIVQVLIRSTDQYLQGRIGSEFPPFRTSVRVLSLLSEMVSRRVFPEARVNDLLFFVIRILFVRDPLPETDHSLGPLGFEDLRLGAMKTVGQIYACYQEQQDFILQEVLQSPRTLPSAKRSARQYKLPGGQKLQLTSVLLLKMVQIDSSVAGLLREWRQGFPMHANQSSDIQPVGLERLPVISACLLNQKAVRNANLIISRLFDDASIGTTVTDEKPRRRLFELFIEDAIEVLGAYEWPSAEVLIYVLTAKVLQHAKSQATPVSVRHMALRLLGTTGGAILSLWERAKQSSSLLKSDKSTLSIRLCELLDTESIVSINFRTAYQTIFGYLAKTPSDALEYHFARCTRFLQDWEPFDSG